MSKAVQGRPQSAREQIAVQQASDRRADLRKRRLIAVGSVVAASSSTDVLPNTPTVSFYGSTYVSKYVAFSTTEAQKVDKSPLQPLTSLDKSLMATYDVPPYVPAGYNGSFPFVDFGNKYVIGGASCDPGLLAGLSWGQIAADLANPASPVGRAIDATANRITAAICTMTGDKPGDVCASTGVTSASGSI